MKERSFSRRTELICYLAVLCGIAFNLLCSIPADLINNFPFYFDTIGTIVISGIAGIFPGILTGVATNIIKHFSYQPSPYYAILSAAIAVICAYFFHNNLQKKARNVILLIIVLAFIGGVPGTWINLLVSGGDWSFYVAKFAAYLEKRMKFGHYFASYTSNFLFDIIDKTISVTVALIIMQFIPDTLKNMLRNSGLKQEYVPPESRKASFSKMRKSLSFTTAVMIALITLLSIGAMSWVSSMVYEKYARQQAVQSAKHAIDLAIEKIDGDELRACITYGSDAEKFDTIHEMLYVIRDTNYYLKHMYVMFPREDGIHIIYDLEANDDANLRYGEVAPYIDEVLPYKDNLLHGQAIEKVESRSERGWLLSVMEPFYWPRGNCMCYICGDIDISDLNNYHRDFMISILLITFALLLVVIAGSFRITRNRIVLPINSMAYCANEFIADYAERGVYDEARRINRLKISTNDEIENMYRAFKKMTVDMVAREQNIRKQADTISRMQSGLIVILADMVENRDDDTGNHIKRTASYVRMIMEGLKKKGYYLDQLTDTFISDVIQSAPLHDLGKIGISDTILNKPGKLTPEEFEIMKQHTVIGCDILDRAISEIHGESYLREARNLAHYHHEKWAGGGYPEGLSGEDIPLSARIMSIADVFDAVSQKRVYKEAFSFEKSVEIIYRDSGKIENDGEENMAV